MPCVYVLYSQTTGKSYIGSSRQDNPIKRLNAHNSGKTKSTKAGRPWKVEFFENYENYSSARKREIFLKSGQGRKFIKENLISRHQDGGVA